MIKKILILVVILIAACNKLEDKKVENSRCKFADVDFDNLIGKNVGSVIYMKELRGYTHFSCEDPKPGVLSGVSIYYRNKSDYCKVMLNIRDFRYIVPFCDTVDWDTSLVSKETISSIYIWHNEKLIKKYRK